MNKIKLLPITKRPDDYLIRTCPNCGKTSTSRTLNEGAQLSKTIYSCDYRVHYLELNQLDKLTNKNISIENICKGRTTWEINPKYL